MATLAPLQQDEIEPAAQLIAVIFADKWLQPARDEFSRIFAGEKHPTYLFTAKIDDKIVGVAGCVEAYFNEFTYGLCWVGVLPEHRRQGIATRLIAHVEKHIKHTLRGGGHATVLLSSPNERQGYYEKMGYVAHPVAMHDGSPLLAKVL